MSLSGGTADKLGGRYETRWTLNCVLRVLSDDAEWILVEPPGEAGEGIEFVFARDGREEHHQVKRQRTGEGHWSLQALRAAGVLGHFKTWLDRGGNPRFISGHDAHQLHELVDRARGSQSLSDFLTEWLGKAWTDVFQTLSSMWNWTERETYEGLQRCDVIPVGDDELQEWNRSIVGRLIEGDPNLALASLAQIVTDNLQQRLDPDHLWRALEGYSLGARRWADPTIREQVRELTAQYRAPLRAIRLREPISRPEAETVLELLSAGRKPGVLLAGAAGAGKSDVILQVLEKVEEWAWPTLALRVDRLHETPRPEGLGEQLGFPASPASVLEALAPARPSLLVVDQLDAVSMASGRLRRLWEPVYALLQQAQANPEMRILLACRQFDLDNDHRLRRLTAEGGLADAVPVAPLGPKQIDDAVRSMGGDPSNLTPSQRRLLELPLHLTLLEPLVDAGEEVIFSTANELFEAYWDTKRQMVEERDERIAWNRTLKLLSTEMSARHTLSVAQAVLEEADLDRDARVLSSEQVLVHDGRSFAFFHESFFDYTFARYLIGEGRRVMDLLEGDEQDLFRRGQVRQVLLRERDANRGAYLLDLEDLLGSPAVRFHVKQLVLALLQSFPDPLREELYILRRLLEGEPDDARWALSWRVIATPAWFALADAEGYVEDWMASTTPEIVNAMVRALPDAASVDPARVATLVREADDGSIEWRARRGYIVRFTDVYRDRGLFDLLLDHAGELPLGDSDHELWLNGHGLPEMKPAWASELLTILLARAQERAVVNGFHHPFTDNNPLQNEYTAVEYVGRLAAALPAGLVAVALPWALSVAQADIDRHGSMLGGDERLDVDRVWGLRQVSGGHDFSDALLAALEAALRDLALTDVGGFAAWAKHLAESNLEVAQYLLYRGVLGNPSAFADWTAEQLLRADSRWRCGYVDDSYWVTRELLAAISPHLTPALFEQLERELIGWTPSFERSAAARKFRGSSEFKLLSALDRSRVSSAAKRRLGELQRKLGRDDPDPPRGISIEPVVSPIGADAAKHMGDNDWLKAIDKHRGAWEERPDSSFVGGAEELARLVQDRAQSGRDSSEAARDPRGFAVKFYTEDGNWDLVGNNLGVFFIRDAIKFPDFIHSQKARPGHLPPGAEPDLRLHQPVARVDAHGHAADGPARRPRELPHHAGLRRQQQVGQRAERDGAREVPLGSQAGRRELDRRRRRRRPGRRPRRPHRGPPRRHRARRLPGVGASRADHARRRAPGARLRPARRHEGLARGAIRAEARGAHGARSQREQRLRRERADRLRDGLVDGLDFSDDKMLVGRTFSYSDTQRYRVGPNYLQIPVNQPKAPVATNQRDGLMAHGVDDPGENPHVNYEPSITGGLREAEGAQSAEQGPVLEGRLTRARIPRTNDYKQAGERYQLSEDWEKDDLVFNLVDALSECDRPIQERMVWHLLMVEDELGLRVGEGLEISVDDVRGLPPLATQEFTDEEHERLANLGSNGPREVSGRVMTHCVPNERDVRAEEREGVAAG